MADFIFSHIGYALVGLFLVTSISCVIVNTAESFAQAGMLGLLTMTGWIPSLWNNPESMAVAHLAVLIGMLLSLYGPGAKAIIFLMLSMIIADIAWLVFPHMNFPANGLYFPASLFWWQSVLNIIFICLCIRTLMSCYHSHSIQGFGSDHHGSFYARIQGHHRDAQ